MIPVEYPVDVIEAYITEDGRGWSFPRTETWPERDYAELIGGLALWRALFKWWAS